MAVLGDAFDVDVAADQAKRLDRAVAPLYFKVDSVVPSVP